LGLGAFVASAKARLKPPASTQPTAVDFRSRVVFMVRYVFTLFGLFLALSLSVQSRGSDETLWQMLSAFFLNNVTER
jgi:hypothetical protein